MRWSTGQALAWCDTSPLHALMKEYDLSNGQNSTADAPVQNRAKTALEQFLRKVLLLLLSSLLLLSKTALEQFLRKVMLLSLLSSLLLLLLEPAVMVAQVLYLAAARIQEMCTRLLLPSMLMKQVWN